MKLKFKVIASLCSAMIFSAAIFGVIYSCSSDECDIINSSMEDVVVNKNPLMISVENSNEFLAFIKENESVMAKFLMYKETLSESDYNELMSNVNDDDYLLDIINKADMLNDLQRLGAKMNSLLANTQYERLNQMEKIQLFNDYFEASNIVKVKTRSEVLYATCYEQYNSARNYAEAKCSAAVLACSCLIVSGPGACACVLAALDKLDDDLQAAKRDFENCQRQHH